MLPPNKTFDEVQPPRVDDLVDYIIVAATRVLVFHCPHELLSRKTFSRVKMHQADFVSYCSINWLNDTYSTHIVVLHWAFPQLSRSLRAQRARYYLIQLTAVESRFQGCQDSQLAARLHKLHPPRYSSNNDVVSPNYSVRLTAYDNCTTSGISLHRSVFVVVDALHMNIE